ncbi:sphinganine-1-phosphate aldolase [Marchantia polymorpha subsp. ruderalis]|uniref:sphinganine-1-phosphate aldolase n=1 Tax=Marchantia polymorpha TaxID=3197 RepID=A0A2R6WR91_MARPO|nr:hypothetical protein MARPO_0064s0066 [Marchantia polymorpha]BBN18288.1 hypothetical protein Mp_8g01320 [Marchantia polymorpha subsp. ruderalis]|eukprot:PTQ36385.1 hypothetical protein MARPO_0064s0066 [Marchantia polymorpha]
MTREEFEEMMTPTFLIFGEKLEEARRIANDSLSRFEPVYVVIASISCWIMLSLAWRLVCSFYDLLAEQGLKTALVKLTLTCIKLIPGANDYIKKEQNKVIDKLQASMKTERECWRSELPSAGLGTQVIEQLKAEKSRDKKWQGKCSGAVYIGGSETEGHFSLVNEAYCLFAHTNPLHPDVFPSVSRFEAEVVAMTSALFGSKHSASGGQVCGNMTSGGTESILMAVKSSRDYMQARRGVTQPEIIIPVSAHSAYDKAAQYFKIKLRRAPVKEDLRVDVQAVKKLINKNTIIIVGSAPGFPHGVIDPIEELGALALGRGICFHVDLCLGGFVLPFAKKLGYPIPAFDFTVPGVTSMSVDVHKYGLGPKGTSVVLYRDHEIRKHQFVAVTDWSGGLYISPSMAGSRSGALIAGAWASMMALGEKGYLDSVRKVMDTSQRIQKGISLIPGLYVLGKPDMTVVAFGSNDLDIYKVNDVMASRGWSLNALHRPASIHICVTLQHVDVEDMFLKDLEESVNIVKENPGKFEDGMAPIYGAAAKMPDRGTVGDILVAYMDTTC